MTDSGQEPPSEHLRDSPEPDSEQRESRVRPTLPDPLVVDPQTGQPIGRLVTSLEVV